MTNATERFKMLLANALERVCVLEEQLELARERIHDFELFFPENTEKVDDNSRPFLTLAEQEELVRRVHKMEDKSGDTEDANRAETGEDRESD
jgi:hypothetical protein